MTNHTTTQNLVLCCVMFTVLTISEEDPSCHCLEVCRKWMPVDCISDTMTVVSEWSPSGKYVGFFIPANCVAVTQRFFLSRRHIEHHLLSIYIWSSSLVKLMPLE